MLRVPPTEIDNAHQCVTDDTGLHKYICIACNITKHLTCSLWLGDNVGTDWYGKDRNKAICPMAKLSVGPIWLGRTF